MKQLQSASLCVAKIIVKIILEVVEALRYRQMVRPCLSSRNGGQVGAAAFSGSVKPVSQSLACEAGAGCPNRKDEWKPCPAVPLITKIPDGLEATASGCDGPITNQENGISISGSSVCLQGEGLKFWGESKPLVQQDASQGHACSRPFVHGQPAGSLGACPKEEPDTHHGATAGDARL